MRSKRERLADFLDRTGISALLEHVQRRSGLLVLNYHRIGAAEECQYDRGLYSASADQLEEQVKFLVKSELSVTTLEEAQFLAENPAKMKYFHVLLTFDDGYVDNFELAFPILRSHGVQAVFFLPTSFIGTNRLPWWDRIAWLVRNAKTRTLQLHYPDARIFHVTQENEEETIGQLLRIFKSERTTNTAKFLQSLETACEASVDRSERLFMTMEEAAEMLAGGMAIGSHTHSHELLGKQSEEEQLEELRTSQAILNSKLGIKSDALAFPVGSKASFSEVTYSAMRRTNYRTGFSFYGGLNTPGNINPMNIMRVPVESAMSLPFFRLQARIAAASARAWF